MPGGPADKAGIQAGDIILRFGEGEVKTSSDLPLLVGNTPIGTTVPVILLRNGTEKTINVTVAKLESKDGEDSGPTEIGAAEQGSLGIVVGQLTAEELQKRKLSSGVLIEQVVGGSPAARAGLEAGDVVVSINNQPVKSPADLKAAVQAAPSGKPLALLVQQGENTRFLTVTKP